MVYELVLQRNKVSMDELYNGDIETGSLETHIKMVSIESPENSYDMSVPTGESFLADLFSSFKQSIPSSKSFVVPKDDINSAISHYRHNAPAPDKLPDKNK